MTQRKEIVEVQQLRAAMARYDISAITASQFVGCSAKTLYDWMALLHVPTEIWRRKIRAGLRSMEKSYWLPVAFLVYHYRRAVWDRLSNDEKEAALELITADGGQDAYLAELKRLATVHNIKVKLPATAAAPRKKR